MPRKTLKDILERLLYPEFTNSFDADIAIKVLLDNLYGEKAK